MDEAERAAKRVVEATVGGARMEFRPPEVQSGSEGPRHDFDLRLPGGDVAAVEATAHRDEGLAEIVGTIRSRGRVVEAETCDHGWALRLDRGARVKKAHEEADRYLARLEDAGVESFRRRDAVLDGDVRPVVEDLGVVSGRRLSRSEDPEIHLQSPTGGGSWVHHEIVLDALEPEVRERGNRRKLAETGAAERHLFVLLHHYEAASVVLPLTSPPEGRPDLPEEVTHLWAATRSGQVAGGYVVWRASRTEAWRSLGVIGGI